MLVLNRKRDERIIITTPEGRRIDLVIVDIRAGIKGDTYLPHGLVRLGFQADRDVTIHREEVAESIERDGAREGVGE